MNRTRLFFGRWQNWLGLLLILVYVLVAIAAPYLSPDDPKGPGPFMQVGRPSEAKPSPPREGAPLGTLPRNVDVYHALVWGSRDALSFGLIVAVSTALFGILYGAFSGFVGGRVGSFMIRVADSFLAFPAIAGLVFLQQLYGTTVTALGGIYFEGQAIDFTGPASMIQYLLDHVDPLMLSLIALSWMPYARLVNSIVLTLKQTDFIQASRALGGNPFWIIRKHLLPNSTGPAMVLAARDVGGVVVFQATLTFINIGGGSVWGSMLAQGRNWILGPGGSLFTYWWAFLPPTLAVIVFGVAWNMFGDSLNDVLVPTTHETFRGQSFWNRKRMKDKTGSASEDQLPASMEAVLPLNPPAPVKKKSSVDGDDPVLHTAREDLSRGDLPRALHAYDYLIRHNRLIEQVLPDLAQLAKKYPRDPQVWQSLGDALTRAGQSGHATQSYDQARKLKQ